jgi:hypothetical protein
VEGVRGRGVAFKWGAEVSRPTIIGDASDEDGGAKALDQEMADYWRERPEQWALLSEGGRQTLSMDMFGDPYAADETFGAEAG